jgi:hypothetical protein
MELSLEAVAEQPEIKIHRNEPLLTRCPEETRRRLVAYFRAWKLPASDVEELAERAIAAAEQRLREQANSPLETILAEEADRLLCERIRELVGDSRLSENGPLSEQNKLALLWAGCAEKWHPDQIDPVPLNEAFDDGMKTAALAQQTQRPPETQPMVMQTSLTRLPSFRMIGGWFVLVALIVLAFIFTR